MKALMLALALLPLCAVAQVKSNTSTDQFTGAITSDTYDTTFASGLHCWGTSTKHKGDSTGNVSIVLSYMTPTTTGIDAKSDILLHLANGEVLKTYNQADYQVHSAGEYVSVFFSLDPTQIKLLLSSPVTAVRIHNTAGYEDYALTGSEEQQYFANIYKLFATP